MDNKTLLINDCCDLFGYSASDFGNMTHDEILDYLTEEEREELKEYNRELTTKEKTIEEDIKEIIRGEHLSACVMYAALFKAIKRRGGYINQLI